MYFIQKLIADNERAFELHDGRFARVLTPGRYLRYGLGTAPQFLSDRLDRPQVNIAGIDALFRLHAAALDAEIVEIDLAPNEVGLLRERGKLVRVLAPGSRQYFWRASEPISVERVDLTASASIPALTLAALRAPATAELAKDITQAALIVEVGAEQVGLLWVDGVLAHTLSSGVYGYWRFGRSLRIETVDTRLIELDVSGQDILTRDKVSIRANVCAVYRVTDALKLKSRVADVKAYAYRELQFGLRQAVGTRSLDALLQDKGAVDEQVADYARSKLQDVGVQLVSVGVKDLILPGDMKALLNQVVEAEKQAQANLIKRREETAATRSLLNTAKLLEESPILLRLKELETLEKITSKVGQLNVVGGLDSLMKLLPK